MGLYERIFATQTYIYTHAHPDRHTFSLSPFMVDTIYTYCYYILPQLD
jgi:hypothetical protein